MYHIKKKLSFQLNLTRLTTSTKVNNVFYSWQIVTFTTSNHPHSWAFSVESKEKSLIPMFKPWLSVDSEASSLFMSEFNMITGFHHQTLNWKLLKPLSIFGANNNRKKCLFTTMISFHLNSIRPLVMMFKRKLRKNMELNRSILMLNH